MKLNLKSGKIGLLMKIMRFKIQLKNQSLVEALENQKTDQKKLRDLISKKEKDHEKEIELRKEIQVNNQNLLEAIEKQKIDKKELNDLISRKDSEYKDEQEKYSLEIKELRDLISKKEEEYESEIELRKEDFKRPLKSHVDIKNNR